MHYMFIQFIYGLIFSSKGALRVRAMFETSPQARAAVAGLQGMVVEERLLLPSIFVMR